MGRVHSVEEAPFWQGHVYGVVVGIGVEDVKNGIKRLYPRDTSIKRPLRVRECTDVPKALSYAVKPAFVRRVSYVDPRTGRDNTTITTLSRLSSGNSRSASGDTSCRFDTRSLAVGDIATE